MEQIMNKQIKWVGVAMVVGGLLMFTRMAPIFAVLPDDIGFPPETTQELIKLAAAAGSRWEVSHLMGFAAVILFTVAYGWHANFLIRLGWKRIGLGLAVISTTAFGLFAIALLVDGFYVSATIDSYVSANSGRSTTLEQVAESHQLALFFFTPGILLVFVAMGLLSLPMLFREFHSRWLGIMGQIIAVTAVTAYVAGLTGPNWNELQIAGTLMMSAFAWNLLVGMRALLVKSHDSLIGKATI
jgi:hypothetical protein